WGTRRRWPLSNWLSLFSSRVSSWRFRTGSSEQRRAEKRQSIMHKTKPLTRVIIGLILVLSLIFFLFPVVWMFLTSFKTNAEVFGTPPVMFPARWGLENYIGALGPPPNGNGGLAGIRDSLIVSLATAVVSVAAGSLAAYSLARYRLGGQQF